MLYRWRVGAAKSPTVRRLRRRLSPDAHARWSAEDYLREAVTASRGFIDVGGMWQIHGAHAFAAEERGATPVTLVDIYATAEFHAEHERRGSRVRLVTGDVAAPATTEGIAPADTVWCWGVLYHHPDPHRLVAALAGLCTDRLVLETLTIPEVPGLPNAAVYVPHLPPAGRRLLDTSGRGGAKVQLGLGADFAPDRGFANNFWVLSPSAVTALLRTHGFAVRRVAPSPNGALRHVFVAQRDDSAMTS